MQLPAGMGLSGGLSLSTLGRVLVELCNLTKTTSHCLLKQCGVRLQLPAALLLC